MLRDSSTIPKRTHHNKHEINDTCSSLKCLHTPYTLATKRENNSRTHQSLHGKRSVLHDSQPISDLLSLSDHEWTPPNNTTHCIQQVYGPMSWVGYLAIFAARLALLIELIKICLLLMYTAQYPWWYQRPTPEILGISSQRLVHSVLVFKPQAQFIVLLARVICRKIWQHKHMIWYLARVVGVAPKCRWSLVPLIRSAMYLIRRALISASRALPSMIRVFLTRLKM